MIIVYDLEFTSWDGAQDRGWTGPDEFREIVQIGALRVASDTLLVEGEFDALIRPARNPRVSGFFERLTGIGNREIEERGTGFLTAFNRFLTFCDGSYALSYGNDMVIIGENIVLQIPPGKKPALPLPPFVNIRPYVNRVLPATKELNAGSLAGAEGGSSHNALADCYAILETLRRLRGLGHPLVSVG
jgi:inhibitor of KinA sporulation pathway (predicted exonuclease)